MAVPARCRLGLLGIPVRDLYLRYLIVGYVHEFVYGLEEDHVDLRVRYRSHQVECTRVRRYSCVLVGTLPYRSDIRVPSYVVGYT